MKLALVGSGKMAEDYAKVLTHLNQEFTVVGRGIKSADKFRVSTGLDVIPGGIRQYLKVNPIPDFAIVSTGIIDLFEASMLLIESGVKRILVEKPGSINLDQLHTLKKTASDYKSSIFIAYNRRFYASVAEAKKIIDKDGGLKSIQFEFTEWPHVVSALTLPKQIKAGWVLANSSHVIDLFFYLAGKPKEWSNWVGGGLDWHPSGSIFCGSGVTEREVFFSYLSNWSSPGRWRIEMMTMENRIILCPLEELSVVRHGSTQVNSVVIDANLDLQFKPGLLLEVSNFIRGNNSNLCTLSEHVQNYELYCKIAGYL